MKLQLIGNNLGWGDGKRFYIHHARPGLWYIRIWRRVWRLWDGRH